jgi:hypothetical protein
VEGLKTVLQPQLGPEAASLPTAGDSALSPTTPPAAESPTTLTSTVEHDSQEAQSSTVQTLLTERRTRLEAQKKAQDAAEKQDRVAKAKARREAAQAAEATNTAPGSARARDVSYAQQQRKKQLEARQERERIMKLVENDKAERRDREERRKATIGTGKTPAPWGPGVPDAQYPRKAKQNTPTSERECAIQVRLLDGSTIRARFPSSATFRGVIRRWIDQQRSDGDTPYTLKQILTPSPNRAITISEEEESLQALGLAPSATLVLVPIRGYTNAYQASTGLLSGAVSTGYCLLSSGAGLVAGALGTFLAVGRPAVPQDDDTSSGWNTPGRRDFQDQSSSEATNSGPGGNIKTLRDHEVDGNDRQFYNGNQVRSQVLSREHFVVVTDTKQLNFEPNRDDDVKEE